MIKQLHVRWCEQKLEDNARLQLLNPYPSRCSDGDQVSLSVNLRRICCTLQITVSEMVQVVTFQGIPRAPTTVCREGDHLVLSDRPSSNWPK